jgi:HMG-box domain
MNLAMTQDLSDESYCLPTTAADSFLPLTTAGPPPPPSTPAVLHTGAFLEKPKRPLSAYNIFFKIERQRMIEEQEEQHAAVVVAKGCGWPARAPKIGFAAMARTISQRWKTIDPLDKQELEYIAAVGRQRYYEEVEEWRRSMRDREDDHISNESPNEDSHPLLEQCLPLLEQYLPHPASPSIIVQENDGALFNDTNANCGNVAHMVQNDVAEYSSVNLGRNTFYEHMAMMSAEDDCNPEMVKTFNNINNTIISITKDGDVHLFGGDSNDGTSTTIRRIVSTSSTLSLPATKHRQSASNNFQNTNNSNSEWNNEIHPIAELALKMGDECCDLLINLFRP